MDWIFIKYISDAFEGLYEKLKKGEGEYAGADPEDRDEYKAENVFFVPPSAHWSYLRSRAKLPEIGKNVDSAMDAIERDNPSLKGVLPKVFARGNLDPASLCGLINLISNLSMKGASTGSAASVNRRDEILFIDARNMGHLINRRTREFSDEDIQKITGTYHNWRTSTGSAASDYKDVKGFCKSAAVEEVAKLDYVLTPGRCVGLPDNEDDFDFEERFSKLKAELKEQMLEEERLNVQILENLSKVIIPNENKDD